jgi:hypothetical protein
MRENAAAVRDPGGENRNCCRLDVGAFRNPKYLSDHDFIGNQVTKFKIPASVSVPSEYNMQCPSEDSTTAAIAKPTLCTYMLLQHATSP